MEIFDTFDIISSAFPPLMPYSIPRRFRRSVDSRIYEPSVLVPKIKTIYTDDQTTTVVKFTDGSKVIVKLSPGDKFSLETAIVFAIAKRSYAKSIDKNGEADCSGFSYYLEKLVKNTVHSSKKSEIDDSMKSPTNKKFFIGSGKQTELEYIKRKCNTSTNYVRPDKKFADFTQDEKRAYWRYHSSLKKNSKRFN